MLNGYSGIRTRNFGLCLPSLLVGQTMTMQSWTGSLDECPDPQLDFNFKIPTKFNSSSTQKKWLHNVEFLLLEIRIKIPRKMRTSTAGGDLKVSLPGLCDEIETKVLTLLKRHFLIYLDKFDTFTLNNNLDSEKSLSS